MSRCTSTATVPHLQYNFNITFPIADWLLGTTYRGAMAGPGLPQLSKAAMHKAAVELAQ